MYEFAALPLCHSFSLAASKLLKITEVHALLSPPKLTLGVFKICTSTVSIAEHPLLKVPIAKNKPELKVCKIGPTVPLLQE